jgi:hypothetical protein
MEIKEQTPTGTIIVHVNGCGEAKRPIRGALVTIHSATGSAEKPRQAKAANRYEAKAQTGPDGRSVFNTVPRGDYLVSCEAFTTLPPVSVTVARGGCTAVVCLDDPFELTITPMKILGDCTQSPCNRGTVGSTLHLLAEPNDTGKDRISELRWSVSSNASLVSAEHGNREMLLTPLQPGPITFSATVVGPHIPNEEHVPEIDIEDEITADSAPVQPITGDLRTTTTLTRTETSFTEDTALWMAIINSTEALAFNNYLRFMDWIFCGGELPTGGFEQERFFRKAETYRELRGQRFLPFTDTDAYRVVKAATEAFVMVNCGVQQKPLAFNEARDNSYLDRRDLPIPSAQNSLKSVFNNQYLVSSEGDKILPYLAVIRRKLPDIPIKRTTFVNAFPNDEIIDNCFGILQEKLVNPCLMELIWSYWQEEGMLVQTLYAISRRFQNVRAPDGRDPLANLEIDPLRPLNNLLWSYIQDEQHRLNVARRNYEYDHHYGLRLQGKAVRNFRPADTRSKFLEGFHHLLRLCTVFYKQDDDTTVKADAFPVLNALKEVHLVLSQGAHNQFGDLPSTARIEMLTQQWLLARPEFREFLPTRIMVAYPEPWMDRVDAMKKLQGWTDTSVLHFRNLAVFGEQILLSIRWGHWSDVHEPIQAFNWARFFRPQVQGYIHAYRAATGVDLTADPTVDSRVDATMPSVLLQRRLAMQQRAS